MADNYAFTVSGFKDPKSLVRLSPCSVPAEVVSRPEDIHPKIALGTVSLLITQETIHDMGGSELQPARALEVAMVHSIFTAKSV